MTSVMDKENGLIQMEILTKENGQMTKQMDTEFIRKLMDISMKALGKMINHLERVCKPGLMGISTRENSHSA